KQRGWHVANVWCKTKRSTEAVAALALLLAVLQNSLAEVRACFTALATPIQRFNESALAGSRRSATARKGPETAFAEMSIQPLRLSKISTAERRLPDGDIWPV